MREGPGLARNRQLKEIKTHEGKERSIGVQALLSRLYLNESTLYMHKYTGAQTFT